MKSACNRPVCGVCGEKLVKNGRTSAGRTRWRCLACGASTVKSRPDISAKAQADLFIKWLLEGYSIKQLGIAKTSFATKTAWCWKVRVPKPQVTGEIYDQILLDGIYLPYNWCLITATNGKRIIDWQWCQRENAPAYQALMNRLPPPQVVVTDGGAGIRKALRNTWPKTRVQRCLFHVKTNTITDLTRRPKTAAGKALLALTNQLLTINTPQEAANWIRLLHQWHQLYQDLINEKTYSTGPSGKTHWWWTHERLRRAYKRLERLSRSENLFTYLEPEFANKNIHRTTNQLEGGINAPIRRLLNTHRGLSEPHMKKAIQWLINQKSTDPTNPAKYLTTQHKHLDKEKLSQTQPNPPAPPQYDTAIDYNPAYQDGSLHIRKGWAGH